jgi:hypothetical protein
MPTEQRRVRFSQPEVISAMRQFYVERPGDGTGGQVEEAFISVEKSVCAVRGTIRTDQGSQAFEASGATLAAALIRYCAKLRIPLPKKSIKTLKAQDGHLILVIEVTPEEKHRRAMLSPAPMDALVSGWKNNKSRGLRKPPQSASGTDAVKAYRFRRELGR